VMTVSNATGRSATPRFADAFGNRLAAWDSGLWAEDSGRGHNTIEADGDLDLMYMHQRWYDSKLGVFASEAPYPPMKEHAYGFAEINPITKHDVWGMLVDNTCFQKCLRDNNYRPPSQWMDPRDTATLNSCRTNCSTNPNNNFFELNCKTGCDDAVADVESRLGSFGWTCYCNEQNAFGLPNDSYGTHFYMTCLGPNGEIVHHNPTIGLWPIAWLPW
ncbi:MAG: RHS repeat-associated core domain-containing protein, partial [Sumerlaeia bacterium]